MKHDLFINIIYFHPTSAGLSSKEEVAVVRSVCKKRHGAQPVGNWTHPRNKEDIFQKH